MYIKNKSLVIRSAGVEDAILLCKWWNDGKVMAHAGFPNGLNTTEEIVESDLKRCTENNSILIIEDNDMPIGEMSYRIDEENVAEIGIKICDFCQQSKGLGTQLLRMLIEYLFNDMSCEKVILDTNLNNLHAQHVYEKLGFRKVSVNIDAWKDQLGNYQSSIDYEMKEEEYKYTF